MSILNAFTTINANDNSNFNNKIRELERKVGELTGRVIALSCELIQERARMKELCAQLGLQLQEDELDDFWNEEEGWVKL